MRICWLILAVIFASYTYPLNPAFKYLKSIEITQKSSVLGVDCIYVINLDMRPEKWKRMQELFSQIGFGINRMSAVNGRELSLEIQNEIAGPNPLDRLRPGQLGCFLSHLSVIKDAYDRGFQTIWVLEDDVEFVEDPHQLIEILSRLKKIDPNWDILYTDLDSKWPDGRYNPYVVPLFRPDLIHPAIAYYHNRIKIDEDLMKIGQRYGAYSLFISRNAMKKILEFFKDLYLWLPIDLEIHTILGIREYSTRRDIVSVWTINNPQKIGDTR